MIDPKQINSFVKSVMESLPDGLKNLPKDIEGEVKTAVTGALGKMDMVTRESFDVQSAVLARTREKLEALEARVKELEDQLNQE